MKSQSNNSDLRYLAELIADFSLENAAEWLRRKFDSFDCSSRASLPLGNTKNEREYFAEIERLGYVTQLPGGKKDDTNRPLLTVAIKMKKELSERTSRLVQFNLAKKLLKEAVEGGGHNLTGLPSQGLFFFYDEAKHFRISLVSGEVENRRFKFNEAKRQSFYAVPGAANNIIKRRLNPKLSTFADVKEAFSVEALTKEFYNALFDWYQWAMDNKVGVTFSKARSTAADGRKQLSEAIIRLITRLMFVWFIKQKGIVPDALFQRDALMDIIHDFQPESMKQDNYYRVILQNLFFATLNCQPDKRKYVRSFHGMSNEQGVKTCYRYKEELRDQDAFLEMMRPVPFLNCALFDCLDKNRDQKRGTPELLLDGFSSKKPRQAHVPNGLFFDEKRGLVKLFNLYEFTVDENNPDDSDVALDPELLGKVFENLLGAFNPETQETARKATGSFYTPREIVDYMVEESLRNYLKTKVPSADDARLDDLFDRNKAAEGVPVLFNADETAALLEALYSCKILDPACGSGAFPMGVLHCMVRLFGRLDPQNIAQGKKLMERYRADVGSDGVSPSCGAGTTAGTPSVRSVSLSSSELSPEDRKERAETLEKQLREGQLFPDYARKLYLIENCIYGVDIQPIATQISKLRFFISLLCDQLRSSYNPKNENYGLLSLPNLEAKFVCANTLLSLPKLSGSDLVLSTRNVLELRQKLQQNRHDIFNARTARTKAKYKERDLEIREAIRDAVRKELSTPNEMLISLSEKVIADALKDREAVAVPKIELSEKMVGADLFSEGHKEWVETDVNAALRKKLDEQIANAKRAIREEQDKVHHTATASTELDGLSAMVAGWDPYDQNACSDFFDPEWMFNIKDGFDIVIGNPPYIQLQANGGELARTYEHTGYTTFARMGDIYCLFYERAHSLLNSAGLLAFITSNKWMRTSYGEALRRFLANNGQPVLLLDFPQERIFEGATVETNILLHSRVAETSRPCLACSVSDCRDLRQYVATNAHPVPISATGNPWLVMNPLALSIKTKMETIGKPLKDWDVSINRGVLTGLNEAFIIDTAQREAILAACQTPAERKRTEELIRPVLRGRDIKRYSAQWVGLWLIDLHNGVKEAGILRRDIVDYPAVKAYLDTFKSQLLKRGDRGDSIYNLRNCAYWQDFDKPMLVWGNLNITASFTRIEGGFIASAPCVILVPDNLFFVGVLNSLVGDHYIRSLGVIRNGGYFEYKPMFVSQLPIPKASAKEQAPIISLVDKILALKSANPQADTTALEAEIDKLVYQLYGLTEEEIAVVEASGKGVAEPEEAEAPVAPKSVKTPGKKKLRRSDDDYLE